MTLPQCPFCDGDLYTEPGLSMTYSWLCCLDCEYVFGEVRVSRTERHAHDLVRDAKQRVLSILAALQPEIHAPERVVIPFARWEQAIKQFGD